MALLYTIYFEKKRILFVFVFNFSFQEIAYRRTCERTDYHIYHNIYIGHKRNKRTDRNADY